MTDPAGSTTARPLISHNGEVVTYTTRGSTLVVDPDDYVSELYMTFASRPEPSALVAPPLVPGATGIQATLLGVGFKAGAVVDVTQNVIVQSAVVTSEETIALTLDVAADATPGQRGVLVYNLGPDWKPAAGAFGLCEDCLTIAP